MRCLSDDPERLRAAIAEAGGNISRAAKALGITKPYAMSLVKKFELNDFARGLRENNGLPSTGRPRIHRPAVVA